MAPHTGMTLLTAAVIDDISRFQLNSYFIKPRVEVRVGFLLVVVVRNASREDGATGLAWMVAELW